MCSGVRGSAPACRRPLSRSLSIASGWCCTPEPAAWPDLCRATQRPLPFLCQAALHPYSEQRSIRHNPASVSPLELPQLTSLIGIRQLGGFKRLIYAQPQHIQGFPVAQTVKNPPAMWRPGLCPWVGKIPWRRAWQPTPISLPRESPWKEEPGGIHFMGSQRVGHE